MRQWMTFGTLIRLRLPTGRLWRKGYHHHVTWCAKLKAAHYGPSWPCNLVMINLVESNGMELHSKVDLFQVWVKEIFRFSWNLCKATAPMPSKCWPIAFLTYQLSWPCTPMGILGDTEGCGPFKSPSNAWINGTPPWNNSGVILNLPTPSIFTWPFHNLWIQPTKFTLLSVMDTVLSLWTRSKNPHRSNRIEESLRPHLIQMDMKSSWPPRSTSTWSHLVLSSSTAMWSGNTTDILQYKTANIGESSWKKHMMNRTCSSSTTLSVPEMKSHQFPRTSTLNIPMSLTAGVILKALLLRTKFLTVPFLCSSRLKRHPQTVPDLTLKFLAQHGTTSVKSAFSPRKKGHGPWWPMAC